MLRHFLASLATVALTLSGGGVHAQVLYQATFASDAEGWTVHTNTAGFPLSLGPTSSGGGQLIHFGLPDGLIDYFVAPGAVALALHSALDGGISWDIGSAPGSTLPFFSSGDIVVTTGGPTDARIAAVLFAAAPPSPALDHVSLGFDTGSPWLFCTTSCAVATQADIDSVLSAASGMLFRAEYWNGGGDKTATLDNIIITGAIPEPETYAMLLAGLGLLGIVGRQRKQKEAAAA